MRKYFAESIMLAAAIAYLLVAGGCGGGGRTEAISVETVTGTDITNRSLPLFNEKLLPRTFRKYMKLDWQLPIPQDTGGEIIDAWLVYDMLFVETVREEKSGKRYLLMTINRETGNMGWVVSLPAPLQYPPTVTARAVYVVIENDLVSIERISGLVRWIIRPATLTFASRPTVIEPPTYPEKMKIGKNYEMERIVIASVDRKVHMMQVVARKQVIAPAVPGGGSLSEPLVEPVFQLRRLWFHITGGDISWEPVVYQNNVFFASSDSYLYCMNTDGEFIYRRRLQGPIYSPVRALDDSVFLASQDSFLYSFVVGENVQNWVHPLEGYVTREIFIDNNDHKNKYLFVPVRPLALAPDDPSVRARMVCIRHEPIDKTGKKGDKASDDHTRKAENHVTLWSVDDAMEVVAINSNIVYLGGSSMLPGRDYNTIPLDIVMAVEKKTGNELWWSRMPQGIFRKIIPYDQNIDRDRVNQRSKTRLYCVTTTNHILCFVEPSSESGPYQLPENLIPSSTRLERGK